MLDGMTDGRTPRLELDWVRTAAGALAAVSSAVLLSTLGAAGTIIGAALGSVVITVGSALYSQGLARSRDRLAQAQEAARRVGIAQAEVRRASRRRGDQRAVEGHLEHADKRLREARGDLAAAGEQTHHPGRPTAAAGRRAPTAGWGDRLARLPWTQIAVFSVGLFAAVLVAITAFEIVSGRSVSSYTGGGDGGTSITDITGDGGSRKDPSQPGTETPTDSSSPTPDEPTTPTPSETPSDSGTPTPTEPTPTTTPTPTGSPAPPGLTTGSPTPTESPTP